MNHTTAPDLISAQQLRQALARHRWSLQFQEPLETQYVRSIHQDQRSNLIYTLITVCVMWLVFAGVDIWRFMQVQDVVQQNKFIAGVFVQRAVIEVLLWWMLWSVAKDKLSNKALNVCVCMTIFLVGLGAMVSSNTIKNLQLPEASVVALLVVAVAFFPLGLRFYSALKTAIALCVMIALSGPLILESRYWAGHWVISAMAVVALLFCGVSGFFREKAQREQFLLKRLLDWEATHDPLTGLANRRMFHEHFLLCTHQAEREGVPLAMAILDIDHFKRYNDCYGHQAGDKVLQTIADLLQDAARRPMDLAVRLGGEEFALITYGDPCERLVWRLKNFQQALADADLAHSASPTSAFVTVSIGAVEVGRKDTLESSYKQADQLLYVAKNEGRNRIVELITSKHPAFADSVAVSVQVKPAPATEPV